MGYFKSYFLLSYFYLSFLKINSKRDLLELIHLFSLNNIIIMYCMIVDNISNRALKLLKCIESKGF